MPVQCSICLNSDDVESEWSVLNACGHTFHTVCLAQALEYAKKCPKCRVELPKCRGNSQPYRRVFFELDELAGGRGGGEGTADDAGGDGGVAVGQLQMKLLRKEQQLQQLQIEARESQERVGRLQDDLDQAHKSLRKAQEKLGAKIEEIRQLGRQSKAAHNEIANLRVDLNSAQTVSSRLKLLADHTLCQDALYQELKRLADTDVQVPGWFAQMLEVRNKQISAVTNQVQQAQREKQQVEGQLKHEVHKLQQEVDKLQHQLEERQQQQQQRAGASGSGQIGAAGAGGGRALGGWGNEQPFSRVPEFPDFVPAPRFSSGNVAKPSLRQRMQRLSSKAQQAGGSRARPPDGGGASVVGGGEQRHGPGALPAPAVAAAAEGVGGSDYPAPHDVGDLSLPLGDPGGWAGGGEEEPGAAGDGGEDEWGSTYSEVESEGELEIVDEITSPSGSSQQQQQQQGWVAADAGEMPGVGPGRAGPPAATLGKRRSPEQQQGASTAAAGSLYQRQPGGASGSGGNGGGWGDGGAAAVSALRPSNRTGGGYNPLPLKAGPSRLALGALGGGPSFMRQPQHATTGFDGKAKYIHRGPDGKGGQVSVYKGGGGAAPVAPAAGGGKRHKGGKGGAAGKGAASNGGVTIDLFFNRAS